MMCSLKINDLSYRYAEQFILQDFNLEMQPGDILGLVGLNGAGKTTLIKAILDLLTVNTGEILIKGVSNSLNKSRSVIAYLPEKFHPPANLYGAEFLELAMALYGLLYNSDAASAMCVKLDLNPKALDKKISHYSKGMGQKLGLISIFLTNAPILLLDEPMSGLDPKARIALKEQIKSYMTEDKSRAVFFSSHIMADMEEICNKIAILHNAKLNYYGNIDDFIKKINSQNLEHGFLSLIESDSAQNGD